MVVVNASNMDVPTKKLQILKHGCFQYILNPAAQKISSLTTVSDKCCQFSTIKHGHNLLPRIMVLNHGQSSDNAELHEVTAEVDF